MHAVRLQTTAQALQGLALRLHPLFRFNGIMRELTSGLFRSGSIPDVIPSGVLQQLGEAILFEDAMPHALPPATEVYEDAMPHALPLPKRYTYNLRSASMRNTYATSGMNA